MAQMRMARTAEVRQLKAMAIRKRLLVIAERRRESRKR